MVYLQINKFAVKMKIKLEQEDLRITWNDNTESIISLKYLRDECPCAQCKGETILLRTYKPAKMQISSPALYKIKNITKVGTYAVQVAWEDGHNTGIYTFEYLRHLANDFGTDKKHDYEPLL